MNSWDDKETMGEGKLGIKRIEAIHYYVQDLERSRRFYVEQLDFEPIGVSGEELSEEGRQRSVAFGAGDCLVVCSTPVGEGGRAWRYLNKHPDGIGALVFEVESIDETFRCLEQRGGTPIADIECVTSGESGYFKTFSITTPFGDTTFRFVERKGFPSFYPGMQWRREHRKNSFGFQNFDHITSNFQTMAPALLWLEHVMGFERYWDIEFHTDDVAVAAGGSGLRSAVMWEPKSKIKFANNEPYRPSFKLSQINLFHEQHRGNGIQHVALGVHNIVDVVRGLRARGVQFMPTPKRYYETLPERLKTSRIQHVEEDLATLEELEILVDGEREGAYLLQIFLKEAAGLYADETAGPFFFEIIERKGDEGFGAGNFRSLFESIEREQKTPAGRA